MFMNYAHWLLRVCLTCSLGIGQDPVAALEAARTSYANAYAAYEAKDAPAARAALAELIERLQQTKPTDRMQEFHQLLLDAASLAPFIDDRTSGIRALEKMLELAGSDGDGNPELRALRQQARWRLALIVAPLRQIELFREWLAVAAKHPEDNPDLLAVRENLATATNIAGMSTEAVAMQRAILEERQEKAGEVDSTVAFDMSQLASFLHDAGFERDSEPRILREQVLQFWDRVVANSSDEEQVAARLERSNARVDLARSLLSIRALAKAQNLLEASRADLESVSGERRDAIALELLDIEANLRRLNGDLAGAKAGHAQLLEKVIASPAHGPDHVRVLNVKSSLAESLIYLGEFEEVVRLLENEVPRFAAILGNEAPELLLARQNLGVALHGLGKLDDAENAIQTALSGFEKSNRRTAAYKAKGDLAMVRQSKGDHEAANSMFTEVERYLGGEANATDLPNLAYYRRAHIGTLVALGRKAELTALLESIVQTANAELDVAFRLSPRETFEVAREVHRDMALALANIEHTGDPEKWRPRLVGMLETVRGISAQSSAARIGLDDTTRQLRAEALAARSRLSGILNSGPFEGEDLASYEARLRQAVTERQTAERALASAKDVSRPAQVDLTAVSNQLPKESALVLYNRLPRAAGGEELVAWVVTKAKPCTEVRLGDASKVDDLVVRWRASIGKEVERGRPAAAKEDKAPKSASLLLELQKLAVAKVLQATGPAGTTKRRLYVCPDSALQLVPLDCLPMDEKGTLVGTKFQVLVRPHIGPTMPRRPSGSGGLLAMGGMDYSGEPSPMPAATRGSDPRPIGRWDSLRTLAPLPGTSREVEAIANHFKKYLGSEAEAVTDADATAARFCRDAPESRYVHIATHGLFLPDVFGSSADGVRELSIQREIETMAPMALSLLTFTGASTGGDGSGNPVGVLTAEEIASLDLRNTELVVLSACETNCGLRASGVGIHSMQSALHAAGARATITTLWKVHDDVALSLMNQFYVALWDPKKLRSPADALWAARESIARAMKASKAPPGANDWMAFVLTTDSW